MNLIWLKPLLFKARGFMVKNAPHLLMGFGTAGSITSLIFAGQATPKAKDAIKAATDEKGEKLTLIEKTKAGGKYYIPAIGLEVFSLGCFWGAHGINVKRQAVLAGLYSTAEAAFKEYQKKVIEMIGDKQEKEIRGSIKQDFIDQNPPPNGTIFLEKDTDRWCLYDGEYFPTSYLKLKDIQNQANHEMIQHMYISKSELKWLLDPDHKYLKTGTDDGQIGWSCDNMMEFDIGSELDPMRHEPVLTLTIRDRNGYEYLPSPGFSSLH